MSIWKDGKCVMEVQVRTYKDGRWYDQEIVDGKEILTEVPKEVMAEEFRKGREEEQRLIAEKGHDCHDFVCHGMYPRDNGSLNDYYYCGKCDDLLQTG
tara:strand:- start:155 stop:448 length:294 start_codon:yes stop_codon:yes gene_type:complete